MILTLSPPTDRCSSFQNNEWNSLLKLLSVERVNIRKQSDVSAMEIISLLYKMSQLHTWDIRQALIKWQLQLSRLWYIICIRWYICSTMYIFYIYLLRNYIVITYIHDVLYGIIHFVINNVPYKPFTLSQLIMYHNHLYVKYVICVYGFIVCN